VMLDRYLARAGTGQPVHTWPAAGARKAGSHDR